MPCAYGIDSNHYIVYVVAEGEVHPHEFIDTFRSLRHDAAHQAHFDVLVDMRRMAPPLFDADLRLLTYYIGSLSKSLCGDLALLSLPQHAENMRQWVEWIAPYGINVAAFTTAAQAQQWMENKDISQL